MEERIQSFFDLNVWQKAHSLTLNIYQYTDSFPEKERGTLVDQLKRASSSVVVSISEGFQRRNKQDKTRLYSDAQSALNDVYYLLYLSNDLGYGTSAQLQEDTIEIQKMLGGLIRSVLGKNKHRNRNDEDSDNNDNNDDNNYSSQKSNSSSFVGNSDAEML
ncbi:MAG: four helix bundle protein [Chitinophagales bacterium]|nr:four helix bundle protein [Chitinophagales bacterium]